MFDSFEKIVTINIGSLPIHIWGILVAIGMLVGLLLTIKEAKLRKLKSDNFLDIFIIVFILGIIGARLLYVVEHIDMFSDDFMKIVYLGVGGLSFFGGFLLSILGIFIYTKIKKLKFWEATDTIVPGLTLAILIGRIGSYLTGAHIGTLTNFPLGSKYFGDLRHEPSLYLALNALILLIFLLLIRPFVKKDGVITYIFIVWYSVARFLIDFTRAYDIAGISDPRYASLTLAQWICIILFVVFAPLLIKSLVAKK